MCVCYSKYLALNHLVRCYTHRSIPFTFDMQQQQYTPGYTVGAASAAALHVPNDGLDDSEKQNGHKSEQARERERRTREAFVNRPANSI